MVWCVYLAAERLSKSSCSWLCPIVPNFVPTTERYELLRTLEFRL
jgi:hypothetical protein